MSSAITFSDGAKSIQDPDPDQRTQTDDGVPEDVEPEEEEPEEEEIELEGRTCYLKDLFQTKAECGCCNTWTDSEPRANRRISKISSKLSEFAILQRKTQHENNGWKVESIVINSTLIKQALECIFHDYPDVETHASPLVFSEPFTPFVHRWADFVQAEHEEEDDETRHHLDLLFRCMEPLVHDSLRLIQTINQRGVVSLSQLPLVFSPGDMVVMQDKSGPCQVGMLVNTRPHSDDGVGDLLVDVQVVEWNGREFGVASQTWKVPSFNGSQKLASLSVTPLWAVENRTDVCRTLISRGQAFVQATGQLLHHYRQPNRGFSERVIVDTEAWYQFQDMTVPNLDGLDTLSQPRSIKDLEEGIRQQDLGHYTGMQYLLMVPSVRGFSLDAKQWREFEVDGLGDIAWNGTAIQSLVLDETPKRLLTAVSKEATAHQTADAPGFDDFIHGKGKGTVVLLHGPPGVGKTASAEAMSEHIHCPLYRLSASDLGFEPSAVEKGLQTPLQLCERWKAMLLIDEADVFLEKRSTESLVRNELVSIFLRLLEYYEGFLILTTNRVKSIDDAFESRIDLTLAYGELSIESRLQIWQNFLDTVDELQPKSTPALKVNGVKPNGVAVGNGNGNGHASSGGSNDDKTKVFASAAVDMTPKDLRLLAKRPLNGRQIKSAVKVALTLAREEKSPLQRRHVEEVLEMRSAAASSMGVASTSPPMLGGVKERAAPLRPRRNGTWLSLVLGRGST